MDIEGCAIVGYELTREITDVKDESGKCISLEPVPNSEKAYLQVRLPSGTVIRAEVSNEDFDNLIAPLWNQFWVLRAQVFESMDNAVVNGYPQHDLPVDEIATDIGTCDSALEGREIDELRPHIEAWLAAHPRSV